MTADGQQMPFVKDLAASDRPTREKALASLQNYLISTHTFTDLELLKIWKGLFFCIFHTPPPLPQQRLSTMLSSILLSLPPQLFLPFLHAFYTTLTQQFSQIPSLRLDKYLLLLRRYVRASFLYLRLHSFEPALVDGYLALLVGAVGPLSPGWQGEARCGAKVPDGLRYHVLDVWVEELRAGLGAEQDDGSLPSAIREQGGFFMQPVRALATSARSKPVRARAREVLREWEARFSEREGEGEGGMEEGKNDTEVEVVEREEQEQEEEEEEEEEWAGFGD